MNNQRTDAEITALYMRVKKKLITNLEEIGSQECLPPCALVISGLLVLGELAALSSFRRTDKEIFEAFNEGFTAAEKAMADLPDDMATIVSNVSGFNPLRDKS